MFYVGGDDKGNETAINATKPIKAGSVQEKLKINVNGTETEYDGSEPKTININTTSGGEHVEIDEDDGYITVYKSQTQNYNNVLGSTRPKRTLYFYDGPNAS